MASRAPRAKGESTSHFRHHFRHRRPLTKLDKPIFIYENDKVMQCQVEALAKSQRKTYKEIIEAELERPRQMGTLCRLLQAEHRRVKTYLQKENYCISAQFKLHDEDPFITT